jgi:hypothetical protein
VGYQLVCGSLRNSIARVKCKDCGYESFYQQRSEGLTNMNTLTVVNPVAEPVEVSVQPATRVPDLNGKRVGLYWNLKAGGDIALQRVEEMLSARYPEARFAYFQGDVGATMRHNTPAAADRLARECDVVVATTSD